MRVNFRCGGIGGNGGGCRRFGALVSSESAGRAAAKPRANIRNIRWAPPWVTFIKIGGKIARYVFIDEEKLGLAT